MLQFFNGFYPLVAVFLAITGSDILKTGEAIGTSSNQVLLGMLVVVLIIVVVYLGRKQDKATSALALKYERSNTDLVVKYDAMIAAFGEERKARIGALMGLVSENTLALNRTATAETGVSHALGEVTKAVSANTRLTERVIDILEAMK